METGSTRDIVLDKDATYTTNNQKKKTNEEVLLEAAELKKRINKTVKRQIKTFGKKKLKNLVITGKLNEKGQEG